MHAANDLSRNHDNLSTSDRHNKHFGKLLESAAEPSSGVITVGPKSNSADPQCQVPQEPLEPMIPLPYL